MAGPLNSIVVATDASDSSNRAVDFAIAIANSENAALCIVTVAMPISSSARREFERVEGAGADPSEAAAQLILTEAGERAGQTGITPEMVLLRGDPAEAIISAIANKKPDAIVVGRRGRGQLAGLLLGSVSQKLAMLSSCLVVIVP